VEVAEIRRVTEGANGTLCDKSDAFEMRGLLHEGCYHAVIVLSRSISRFLDVIRHLRFPKWESVAFEWVLR
jgi:predicted thioredoxin/glutaredoxin